MENVNAPDAKQTSWSDSGARRFRVCLVFLGSLVFLSRIRNDTHINHAQGQLNDNASDNGLEQKPRLISSLFLTIRTYSIECS